MNIERTVIGIKPDAFDPLGEREKGSELLVPLPENPSDFIDEVVAALKAKRMKIIDQHEKICSEELARAHYEEFVDVFSSDFGENKQDFLARYITSGISYWLLCEGPLAVERGREVIKDMREKYLCNPKLARYNMTHGSGNTEEAEREIDLHFKV